MITRANVRRAMDGWTDCIKISSFMDERHVRRLSIARHPIPVVFLRQGTHNRWSRQIHHGQILLVAAIFVVSSWAAPPISLLDSISSEILPLFIFLELYLHYRHSIPISFNARKRNPCIRDSHLWGFGPATILISFHPLPCRPLLILIFFTNSSSSQSLGLQACWETFRNPRSLCLGIPVSYHIYPPKWIQFRQMGTRFCNLDVIIEIYTKSHCFLFVSLLKTPSCFSVCF